jgi:hypothetical protein
MKRKSMRKKYLIKGGNRWPLVGHSTALNGNHPQSTYAMSLVADSSTTQSSEVASKSRKYLMREAIREASEGPSE